VGADAAAGVGADAAAGRERAATEHAGSSAAGGTSGRPELILIRHAETEPDFSVPAERWRLSAAGRAQAGRLAAAPFWSGVEVLVSSDEPKALATAAPAAESRGLRVVALPELREVRRPPEKIGDYAGAVRAYLSSGRTGWEPAHEAAARVAGGFERALAEHPGRTIAAVSHGLVLTLWLAALLGRDDRFPLWRTIGFTGWARVDPRGPRLLEGFRT
jgi:broad specificity phosphatase PhoE